MLNNEQGAEYAAAQVRWAGQSDQRTTGTRISLLINILFWFEFYWCLCNIIVDISIRSILPKYSFVFSFFCETVIFPLRWTNLTRWEFDQKTLMLEIRLVLVHCRAQPKGDLLLDRPRRGSDSKQGEYFPHCYRSGSDYWEKCVSRSDMGYKIWKNENFKVLGSESVVRKRSNSGLGWLSR